jgi:acyl-CoA thioesterase
MPSEEASWNGLKNLINSSPFYRHMDMKVVEAGEGVSRLEMQVKEEMKNLYGIIHGGAVATILDSSCGIAIGSLLKPGEIVVTVDMRVNFISNVRSGTLIGEGRVLHRGKKTGVASAEIRDGTGTLIAVGMSTHFISSPEDVRVHPEQASKEKSADG